VKTESLQSTVSIKLPSVFDTASIQISNGPRGAEVDLVKGQGVEVNTTFTDDDASTTGSRRIEGQFSRFTVIDFQGKKMFGGDTGTSLKRGQAIVTKYLFDPQTGQVTTKDTQTPGVKLDAKFVKEIVPSTGTSKKIFDTVKTKPNAELLNPFQPIQLPGLALAPTTTTIAPTLALPTLGSAPTTTTTTTTTTTIAPTTIAPPPPTGDTIATAPSSPTGVSATVVVSGVALTWTAPSNGGSAITDYVIESSTNGTTWIIFNDGTSTQTTALVTGLTDGTSYMFRVSASNAAGAGDFSSASVSVTFTKASQTTLTLTASSLSATVGSSVTLTVSGGSGAGEISYTPSSGCSVDSNGVLTSTMAQSCTVTATKAADSDYASKTSNLVTVNFTAACEEKGQNNGSGNNCNKKP
jgi:hypothetical protein